MVGVESRQLKTLIERIERLEEEKKTLADDIKEIFAEAKSSGYDVKIMRAALKVRKIGLAVHQEAQETLDTYLSALGDLAGTPLGEAAAQRQFRNVVERAHKDGMQVSVKLASV